MKRIFTSLVTLMFLLVSANLVFAATFTVTNLNDSGAGSLRQAMIDANAAGAGPHTINFVVSGTILINSSLPAIANSGITIDGGGNITIDAQGGDINRDIFTINASNTTIKGFTVQKTGTQCFEVAGNLSNVTIQDIIASHTANVMDNIVYVSGASTNMTIKNIMCLTGMQDGFRAFHFQGGTQTNLLLEDITVNSQYQGIYFQDASVNNLDIINATIYGSYDHIYFNNTGGPVETANDVTIDGKNTASLYSQRDGGGTAMIFSNYVNTNWTIKNLVIDADRANTTDDANYGIRFNNTTSGITLDNVTMHDAEIYGLWFNGAATNITVQNSTFDNFDGWTGTQMIRFQSTVNTVNFTNTNIDLDLADNPTNDGQYGIVFAGGTAVNDVTLDDVTINQADVDGIYVLGPVSNFTLTNSTFTNNYDGIEFYGNYVHSNVNITNSSFTGQTRSGILIDTGNATNTGTISGNTVSNNGSNGIWLYSGNGNKGLTISGNTILNNNGAGIYVNGPDAINITQNSISRNRGNGIELVGGGNLSYEGVNRPTISGSSETAPNSGDYNVTISLPTICNAAGGCTVEVFANNSSDDVEGRYYVQTFTGLSAGTHNLLVDMCAESPCLSLPTGFWTATLKVVNTGSVSEFSNKQTMKTQGPAAVNTGVALWLDAQDALSGVLPSGTGWQDRSGNDRDFDLVFGNPDRSSGGLNYNHYVQFDGGDYLRSSKSPFVNGFSSGEVIVVTRAYYRHLNQGNPYDLGGSSRGFHYSWGNEAVYNGFGTNDRLGWRPATNQILDGKAGVSSVNGTRLDIREWNIFQTYSQSGAWGTGFNGQFVATTNTNSANFNLAGGNEHIGAVSGAIFYGDIAEVIMYSRTLTTAERQKINSYLALKYGTTLDQIAVNQDYYASDWNGSTGTRMWQNDNDGYETNIFGIGRDDNSGLQQKQSESTEQNAILSVAIGASIAAYNDENTATITNDRSFLTFADNNQLQRFGPAVSATNANFRMHRTWKVDKVNWADANVTFQFGEDFAGNYLLIASDDGFGTITSELLLDDNGAVTFNSSLLAHGSYFTVGSKMQLPGCVAIPTVSYPNYQEYYNNVHFPFNNPVGYGWNTNLTGTQDVDKKIAFSGYSTRNFDNSFNCDNCSNIYRAKLNITNPGTYTFYVYSDDNGDIYVDGELVASVYTCCYEANGTITLAAGNHDVEVRQSEGGGADYVRVRYSGPGVGLQVLPVSALTPYTAPGVQTWLKADAGVVESGGVTRWNDVSGNNNDAYQTNASYNPTYNSGNAINFNPAVTTNGAQGMIFKKTIPATNNLHLFAVGTTQSHANWHTLSRGINTDHPIIANGADQFGYYDNNNVGFKGSGQNLSTTEPKLMTMSHMASSNSAQPRLNGLNGTVLNNINEDDIDYLQHFMNLYWQGGNQSFGTVAEFVAVSGTLSATDIQKIESYLAFKYGVTLDQSTNTNYLATTGNMWVNDNDGYEYDIAGIGKDDCQDLHQKQSKSVNSDALVTMAVGDSIMPVNADNMTSITNNLSFLSWANNNGDANSFNTAVNASGVLSTSRLARVWKVDNINFATQNITLNFSDYTKDIYLLISSDPAFATVDHEYILNGAGNVTISSADLPDGTYFTFGKRVAGPACVNTGIVAWLRADDGVTDDGTGKVSNWSDFSGNNNHFTQNTAAYRPLIKTTDAYSNFNPTIYYNYTTNYLQAATNLWATGDPGSGFAVAYHANVNGPWGHLIDQNDNIALLKWSGLPNIAVYDAGTVATYITTPTMPTMQNNVSGVFGLDFGTTANSYHLYFNGFTGSVSSGAPSMANNVMRIGMQVDNTDPWQGGVPEVIIYNRQLTAIELQRVNSYLALKYGITLTNNNDGDATAYETISGSVTEGDYVASDGTTIYWDATANTGYGNDIAGIGRDDCTNLNQKQSKSVNTDAIITMAVGTSLAASNAANANTITNDKSFLVWSNNDGATTFSPAVSGFSNATVRMGRIWKVEKTANWADQDITICASQNGERYLLLSADATFDGASDTEKSFDFGTGCVTFNSSELADDSYFTIATKIAGPACVNAGIKLWLRSDYGVTQSGGAISKWGEYSGNNNSPTAAVNTPGYVEGGINFNPSVTFNGSNQRFNFNNFTSGFTAGEIFYMVKSGLPKTGYNGFAAWGNNHWQHYTWGNQNIYDAFGSTTRQVWVPSIDIQQPNIYNVRAKTGQWTAWFNNKEDFNKNSNTIRFNEAATNLGFGNYYYFNGDIPEVVIYDRELLDWEKNKVNSYIALKYGVTLDQTASTNYVASDWNGTTGTIYWDASANASYSSNIAGIGRDDCTDLNQKQSKSVNTGEILTVALGSTVAASNAANTNTISADNSYFVWGNNNGLNEFFTSVSGTNVTAVLQRVWTVQKTNWTDQNITMCFDGYNDDDYLVISNSSSTFATINQEKQLSSLGCVTFSSADLPDGAYFSIGKNIMAPGCVTGGIVTWLDAQTVQSGNMIDGVGWPDQSGNSKYFSTVIGDPARVDGALNYNHFVEFDGNDALSKASISAAFTEGEVFSVLRTRSNAGHAYAFGGQSNNHFRTDDNYENFGTTDRVGWRNSNNAILDGHPGLVINPNTFEPENWNVYGVWSATNDWAASYNGYVKAQTSNNTVDFSEDATNYIGRGEIDYLNGDVAEVILYRRKLTAAERRRVISYLALKYGVTLDMSVTDQDYVAADGSTMWDWSDNAGYRNDIAGIGRDDCQKLNQKQSISINGDDPLTIALGTHTTFPASNEANTATFADDKSFLVWGNNDGALEFTTAVPKTGINATFLTPRKWKIDKNNFSDQMITISVGQSGERYLLVDEDGSGGFEDDANTQEYSFDFTTGLLNISSANLPDGAVIALGTKIAGPACVNSGINVWLRGDYGATGAQWVDFSGNSRNATQGTPGNQAVYVNTTTNFNPGMQFNGSKFYDFATGLTSISASTFFFVSRTNNTSLTSQALAEIGQDRPGLYWDSGRANNYTFDVTTPDISHPTVYTTNDPTIFAFTFNNANPKNFTIGANGLQAIFTGADGTYPLGTGATGARLGAINFGGGNNFNGDMNEVVVYNRVLTNVERQQVESYLALKYGITLTTNNDGDGTAFEVIAGSVKEGDYVASNGTTIYWDGLNNTGYNSNVAGIGLDICTELRQKQSKSVNAGEILTGALGSVVATSNAANTTAFADSDLSFLVWGHNGGVNDFSNTVTATGTNSMAYLGRVWRAQKTGFSDQDITLCFSGYDADEYLLISNSSATFATVNHEAALDVNGCITFSSSLLPSGAYFTLGKNIQGPACVDGGIKLWLRADEGLTDTIGTVSQWDDVSGNGHSFVKNGANPLPLYETTNPRFNFNPSLNFDAGAGTEELRDDSVGDLISPTALDNYSMFAAMVKVGNSDRLFTTQNTGANFYALDVNQGGRASAAIEYQNPVVLTNNETKLVGITYDGTGPNRRGYHNGKLTIDPAVSAATINSIAAGAAEIGPANGNGDFNGQMAEIIVYNRQVSLVEAQMINSYLALKYGVTLDQTTATDYLASDGTTMWDASDNAGYGNDIAGIGKDDCTNLNQKQSKSVNSDALITMALGTSKEATNQDNPNTITNDKSFLVWSNDNGSTSFATAFTKTGSTINLRTARIWKVDKTNWADQNITICVSQSGERSLIIDNGGDADFADDAETSVHALDFSTGCVTINSSLLPDGAHFSLGTEIKGPACVDAGVQVWLRGDYGYTTTSGPWVDFSGNNKTATIIAGGPGSGSVNFNPAVDFGGSANFEIPLNIRPASMPSISTFIVYEADAASRTIFGNDNGGANDRSLYMNTICPGCVGITGINVTGQSKLVTTVWQNGVTNGTFVLSDGREVHRSTRTALNDGATVTWLGRGFNGVAAGSYFDGRIAEFVIYNTNLTDLERQQVQSYLALKYGITLTTDNDADATAFETISGSVKEGDYVASNGTTIYWDGLNNTGYNTNVAGIGRDSCTNLLQKQSKSVNTGEMLTVALGSTIETSNAANTSTITADRSFFVWGHNSGAEDFLADAGGTNATARLDRVWKVQKTNWTDQTITMQFDGYDDEAYLIIHATDPTFLDTPLEYQLDVNGEVTLNTSDLPDGAFFTLGKNLRGPACVDGGIKVWLRADDGTATGAAWDDYSGNGTNFAQANAGLQAVATTNSMNFNPGLTFTNDDIASTATTTTLNMVNSDYEIIGVAKTSTSNTTIQFPFASGVAGYYEAHVNNGVGLRFLPNGAASDMGTNGLYSNTIPHIFGGKVESNSGLPYVDGKLGTTPVANARSTVSTTLKLGRRGDNTYPWAGDVSEYIVYNRALSATERQKVQSYLALKYGITLDQTTPTDYIASDGATLMWENDSDGFEYDIAGIGKDECTSLEQKQSKSVNSDDVVTFAVGSHTTIPATNADNTSPVTNDLSFFSWANNNGNTDVFSTVVTAINAELRMARIWKVDKFNWQDQEVTLCFDGQIGERYVLIDNDDAGLASIDKEIPLDPLTGCATFNSSELAHGAYFSLGTKILAPGCADNADILTWLRADYGATASQWNDFSGRTTHATQATAGDQPDTGSLMNFNPALDFDGGDFMTLSGLDINYTVTDRNPITVLSVYQADVTDRGIWGNENGGNDRALYMHQVANGVGNTTYSGGNSINQTSLVTTIMDEGTTNGSFIFANGQRTLTFTQSGSGGGTTGTFLGDDNGTGAANTAFDGRIAEFAVYRGALTAAQRQQAESYLAIKYGLTLSSDNNGDMITFEAPNADGVHEGDYVASDGTTVIWDASANSTYHNDVAGIGRDTCTALNQKQSRSANSGDIVTMALGSAVEATNVANTNTFTNDLAFLVWGNDNGITTFNTAQTGMFVNARLGRIWKVQKSANWDDAQDVTLCFDGFDDGNYLLISDNNSFGILDLEQQLDPSGCTTINSAVLENGDVFTLGALVVGPACVNPGIVMWLRADAGIADGTAWNDQSGNEVNATQETMSNEPTLTAGAINFNPALVFDGTNDYMSLAPLNGLPYGASNRTIITVGYSSNTVGNRWMVSYGNNTTSQANFWGQQGTTGNYGGFANDVTSASYWTNNIPILTANTYNGTAATIYKNGAAPVTLNRTWNTVQNKGYIGRQVSDTEYWQGGIGEVIIYDRVLSAAELQQVNSYLALKYGIALDQTTPQDYIASDGSTLMWEAAANGAYKHDIAGIGLDECTGLNQKQSKSSSSDAVITIGLGTVEADNASNSNVFTANLSFMTWANDNGALSEITTDLPAQFTVNAKRLAREWKVDETNTIGAVQVKANLNVPPLAGAISGTVASEIRLLIDRDGDGDFTTGTVDIITASDYSSGVATFDNVDFQDGDVFTVGTKLPDVTLSVKVLLQGAAIDATAGMMRNDLQTYGPPLMMPTTDPYLGTTTYPDMNNDAGVAGAVTDWVLVQIRDANDPSLVLEQKALLVQTDGEVVDETGAAPKFAPQAGAVHIIIQHRNHLAVMSNSIAVFQDAVSYDFTTALTQAYKEDPGDPDPMIQVNGFWTMWAGDKNMDGVIDNLDLTGVKQDFDLFLFEDYFLTDVNLDSVVDNLDLTLTKTNFDLFPYSPIIYY